MSSWKYDTKSGPKTDVRTGHHPLFGAERLLGLRQGLSVYLKDPFIVHNDEKLSPLLRVTPLAWSSVALPGDRVCILQRLNESGKGSWGRSNLTQRKVRPHADATSFVV